MIRKRPDQRSFRANMAKMRELRRKPEPSKAPPSAAQLIDVNAPAGVQFHAPWALWGVGTCLVWRRLARAISETGMPLNLTLDLFNGPAHPNAIAEVRDLLIQKVRPECRLGAFSTAGDQAQAARIRQFIERGGPLALATMIERDCVGSLSVVEANKVAQWWLPCQSNIDAFRRSGVEERRLFKVRVPFFPNDPHLRLVGRQRRGPTHFYRIGTVDKRKDQEKTVRAFLRAFHPGEALLTIKTTAKVTPLSSWYEDGRKNGWTPETAARDIAIVNAVWNEAQLLDLHSRGDVYLSLSHGEGWDLPAFDALLAGNRMVYTASGGPEEFASEGDLLVPTSRMVPCDPVYGWEPSAKWVDFDVEAAARQLREAHEHPLSKTHRRSWAGFTAADVGALAKSLLGALARPTHRRPRAPDQPRKDSLAVVSLFRQCPETVELYQSRVANLRWSRAPEVICVEGDSTDETPEMLDTWASARLNVHVLHHDLGTPLFGSTDNPDRLRALSTVSNVGLDYVVRNLNVEYVLFLTSDLVHEPDLAERLRSVLESRPRAGLVAPMVWRDAGRGDVFYDTWAFRQCATERDSRFDKNPPRERVLKQLGTEPVQLESVGSVLFCRSAPIYAGVRFTHEDVLGFSANMRAAGYSVWADPTTHVHHPRETHPQNIRAPAMKTNLRKITL